MTPTATMRQLMVPGAVLAGLVTTVTGSDGMAGSAGARVAKAEVADSAAVSDLLSAIATGAADASLT